MPSQFSAHTEVIEFSKEAIDLIYGSGNLIPESSGATLQAMRDWLEAFPFEELEEEAEEHDCCGELTLQYSFGDSEFRETRIFQWLIIFDSFTFDHSLLTCDSTVGSDSQTFYFHSFEYPAHSQVDGYFDPFQLLDLIRSQLQMGARAECQKL